ncbi:hypothetical protein JZ785_26440 [Alicyclobacillus curvatus]|nr:hypothetical protein JZ785_26440 [Alicyclobacillus curvatus]
MSPYSSDAESLLQQGSSGGSNAESLPRERIPGRRVGAAVRRRVGAAAIAGLHDVREIVNKARDS